MRILLNVERGFIEPISYKTENEQFARNGGNIGNKIFSQAIYNMLNVPENTIEFVELNDQLEILNFTPEEINEQFDVFIFATVIFGTDYIMRRNIQTYTKIVEGLKIPVFCFSVGTQISSYDQMEDLVNGTKDVAVPFINSVVKTLHSVRGTSACVSIQKKEFSKWFAFIMKNISIYNCFCGQNATNVVK